MNDKEFPVTSLNTAMPKTTANARTQLWRWLNDTFRAGSAPTGSLEGLCAGRLLAVSIAPGLTETMEAITSAWLPWLGKTFDSSEAGMNVFDRESLPFTRVSWPFYRGVCKDGPTSYRAFRFRTYINSGLVDTDRQVLKIDYDLPENPGLTIRRVLDELVQVSEGVFLGKAHIHWWWGTWQTVAFFSLES